MVSESNLLLGQMVGDGVGLLPAIAFFIIYQRYQFLLSSTRNFYCQVHQGNIYYQSKSGEGTIFTIELPINQACRM